MNINDGFKDVKSYVQKYIAPRAIFYNPKIVRKKPLRAPPYRETCLFKPKFKPEKTR